jgi:hypothetical protein
MKTVKMQMFDRRHRDRSIAWAEDARGQRVSPRIRPGDVVTTRYHGAIVQMKVLQVSFTDGVKAAVETMEDDGFPMNTMFTKGTKFRLDESNIFSCEAGTGPL